VKAITLSACAKINLVLEVLGRRADGYHDISTIFQEISLADTVSLSLVNQGIALEVNNDPDLPADERNLAFKAAAIFLQHYPQQLGVNIKLVKRIPHGAGLGGGSSDAAAVLRGLNQLCGQPFTSERLAELACSLGSDVPFFIRGGTALGSSRGEVLTQLPVKGWRAGLVIVKPQVSLSTALMYKQLNSGLTIGLENIRILRLILLEQRFSEIGPYLFNRFEDVAYGVCPRIREIKQALLHAGCSAVLLCGSGSATFGLTQDISAAKIIAQAWKGEESVFVAEVVMK